MLPVQVLGLMGLVPSFGGQGLSGGQHWMWCPRFVVRYSAVCASFSIGASLVGTIQSAVSVPVSH